MSASYTGLPCMRPRTPCYPFGIRLKNLVVGRAVNDERMNLQGYCAWEACDDPRSLVTVAIAGPSADWIFFDVSRSADSQDYRDAHCGARRVAEAEGGEVEAIIARARVDAESLIQQHVAVIKTLAHELMPERRGAPARARGYAGLPSRHFIVWARPTAGHGVRLRAAGRRARTCAPARSASRNGSFRAPGRWLYRVICFGLKLAHKPASDGRTALRNTDPR
jgi:hypothetical protein